MTPITKKIRNKKIIFGLVSFLLNIGPLIGVFIYCLASGEIKTKQGGLTLGLIFVFTLFLTMLNAVAKWHLRTPLWIMIFAIMILIKNVWVVLLIIGISTIVDELIFSPLHKRYREKYRINREIDKRIP